MKPAWYERFPGHFYLNIETPGYEVHVCARGPNLWHPVAMVSLSRGGDIVWRVCRSVGNAQRLAERAYRRLLQRALEELG